MSNVIPFPEQIDGLPAIGGLGEVNAVKVGDRVLIIVSVPAPEDIDTVEFLAGLRQSVERATSIAGAAARGYIAGRQHAAFDAG